MHQTESDEFVAHVVTRDAGGYTKFSVFAQEVDGGGSEGML